MATVADTSRGLRVMPAERRPVALMVLLNALICLGAVSVQTAGFGLFLDRFGPARLAGAYLVSAVATALVSAAYLAAAARLPFPRLTTAVLAAIAGATALEWVAVRAGSDVAVYLLPAWFQVVLAPAMLVYWAVADSLFDVRQARRLFGTITGGRSLGFLVGGLAAPLLLRVVDTPDLLLVTVIALGAAAAVLGSIWRLDTSPAVAVGLAAGPPPIPAPGRAARTLRAVTAHRYHRAIIAFVTVWWIGYFVVDKLFLDAVAAHRADPAAIAGFLGVFYALAALAQLLVGAFGTARITARFGFTASLLATPVLLAALAAVFTAVAVGGGSVAQLLVLAVGLKGIDHAVGFALDFAVHGLSYRPVPLAVVGKVATLAEGFGQAAGLGITALGLLAIDAGLRVGPAALGVTVLVVTALWTVLAADLARRYRRALAGALTRRQFGGGRLALVDRAERNALIAAAADPAPAVALFAARTLGELAPEDLATLLPVLVGHPDAAVRGWAFDQAALRRDTALLGTWTPAGEPDALARAAGVRALVAAGAPDRSLAAWLDADDVAVRRGALEGALGNVLPERRALGRQRAALVLAHGSGEERVGALDALAATGGYAAADTDTDSAADAGAGAGAGAGTGTDALDPDALADAVLGATADPDPEVARAACRAASALPPTGAGVAARALVVAVGQPATAVAAVAALGALGDAAVVAIGEAFTAAAPPSVRRALVDALARIDGPDARSMLLDVLHDEDGPTRALAADHLAAARLAGALLPPSTGARVEVAAKEVAAEHAAALDLLTALARDEQPGDDVLAGALRLALRRVQAELVALAVVVARDADAAGAALRVERVTEGRRPAEVVELLEPALTPAMRAIVVPGLERAARPLDAPGHPDLCRHPRRRARLRRPPGP